MRSDRCIQLERRAESRAQRFTETCGATALHHSFLPLEPVIRLFYKEGLPTWSGGRIT